MPKEDILKSPFFGFGYGTSKPLFIHTQLVHAIGFIGVVIFLWGVMVWDIVDRRTNLYLIGVLALGTVNFELSRCEIWIYWGLLCNPYMRTQRAYYRQLRKMNSVGGLNRNPVLTK